MAFRRRFFRRAGFYTYRRGTSTGTGRHGLTALCAIVIVVLLFYYFNARLMPNIKTIAVNKARLIAAQTVNNAVGEVLKEQKTDYDSLMTIEKDESGHVTAVKSDTMEINRLKYNVTNEVVKELNGLDASNLSIPVGNAIDGELFSGMGPRINVKVEPIGNVDSELENSFTAAGINQTRQQITLKVKTSISIMISSYAVSTDVDSSFDIADTVIVGAVPGSYTVVDDSSGKSDADKVTIYDPNQRNKTK